MPPTGTRLKDAQGSKIGFQQAPNISLWPQEIQPPGGDAGGPNETTHLLTARLRTRQPKKLITLTAMSGVCQYAPRVYADVLNQLGNNQQITVTFSDGSTLMFWGWLDKFTPQRMSEGKPPLADFTIEPSNEDNTGAEQAFVFIQGTTTTTTSTTIP